MFAENCSCSTYVDINGHGNCKKELQKRPICYVNEPSSCQDLRTNKSENGKRYSWEACSGPSKKPEENIESLLPPKYATLPLGTHF